MNNSKLTLMISFFVISYLMTAGQSQKSIIGLYGECEDGYFACEQIELKSDSTFEYGIFHDVGGWNLYKGTWFLINDTLVLNTYKQPKTKEEIEFYNSSFSFIYTEFITNLQFKIKNRKLYKYDFNKKSISRKLYLKKTTFENKKFEIN